MHLSELFVEASSSKVIHNLTVLRFHKDVVDVACEYEDKFKFEICLPCHIL